MNKLYVIFLCIANINSYAMEDDDYQFNAKNFINEFSGKPWLDDNDSEASEDNTIQDQEKAEILNVFSKYKFLFPQANTIPNILKEADHEEYNDVNGIIFYYYNSLTTVLDNIQQKYGYIEVECQLFMQIAAMLLKLQEPKYDNIFTLYKGSMLSSIAKETISPDVEYLGLALPLARTFVELYAPQLECHGQWLLKLKHQFLGITPNGIKIMSKKAWIKEKGNALFAAINDMKTIMENPSAIINTPLYPYTRDDDRNIDKYTQNEITKIFLALIKEYSNNYGKGGVFLLWKFMNDEDNDRDLVWEGYFADFLRPEV